MNILISPVLSDRFKMVKERIELVFWIVCILYYLFKILTN